MTEYLLRSPMFVPGFNRRYIDKALTCSADALILDVEDSVPLQYKQEARDILCDYFAKGLFRGRQVFIRINSLETEEFHKDMEQLVFEKLTGYVPAKIKTADDIRQIDQVLSHIEQQKRFPQGGFVLAPLIETASAVAHVIEIAHASKRLIALCFGGEDYLNSMHGIYNHFSPAFVYPRNAIAVAARSAGLLPIDTPYLEIENDEGFLKEEREMYKIGFAGCLLLNPKQIELAHKAFSPSPEDIRYAEGIIAAVEKGSAQGRGVVVYNGVAVGPPLQKLAQKVLAKHNLIRRLAVHPQKIDT